MPPWTLSFAGASRAAPPPAGPSPRQKFLTPAPAKFFDPAPAKFFDPAAGRAGPRQGRGLAGAYPGHQNSLGNTLVSRLNNDKNEIA